MQLVRNHAKSLFLSLFTFVFFACGGGGCGGCGESCGVQPIPGGYPIAERIDNSAQVRLSESGIQFIEENIGAIVMNFLAGGLDFDIPRSSGSSSGFDYELCPGADCVAHGEIVGFDLTPVAPNRLSAHIRILLDSRDTSGARRPIPTRVDPPLLPASTCQIDLDTRRGGRNYVGVTADIDFVTETRAARAGYTKLVVSNAGLASGEDIENDDVSIGGCPGYAWLLNLFKGTLINQIEGQIGGLIQDALDSQLCTTRGMYGCPSGTFAVPDENPDSTCRYENSAEAECVPLLLGTDGRGDLGAAFLGSLSPGTHAPGQYLLASGGDGEAINNGMSLFFYGGFMGTDRTFTTSPAHNPCVPVIDPPAKPTIPRVDTFRGNTTPSGTAAHVGIGLAESYLNYAGYGMFDSGLLCLGVGTRMSQQLSTGLVAVLINSLRDLAFPLDNAPMSLAIRPQQPPVFTVGDTAAGQPLLTIALNQLSIDFYVWSTERYIRFMTWTGDLTVPVDLMVDSGRIAPMIGEITAANAVVTNAEILNDDPALLAGVIESAIAMFAGMLGNVDPVALPALMGFDLQVPPDGVVGFEESGERFVGLFANLALAAPTMPHTALADTRVVLGDVTIDRRALELATWGQGELPRVVLTASAEGAEGVAYEYSYRVDGMQWSPWTSDSRLVVSDDALLFQARHVIETRARIAGSWESVDPTPARTEVIVDILAPEVEAARTDAGVTVRGWDLITPKRDLTYRFRIDGGAWSEWAPLGESARVAVDYDDAAVDVEVKDEAGNVGRSQAALIRGLPNAAASGGCDCDVPGEDGSGPLGGLALFAFLALALGRGARRGQRRPSRAAKGAIRRALTRFFPAALVLLALGVAGCSCSDDPGPTAPCGDMCVAAMLPATNGSVCCESTDMCVSYDLDALCDPGWTCASPDAVVLDDSCGLSCSNCMRKPALPQGQMATYLDVVAMPDGSLAISGYSPGAPPARRYGDLVLGRWTTGATSVEWDIIDGAPSSPITNDPDGWRGGVSDPGPDVGRWTSIAQAGGTLYISYYDADDGALKMAIGTPGNLQAHVVDEEGDAGRYSSLVLDSAGNPVVAYMRVVPSTTVPGAIEATPRVARASSAMPSGAGDWTFSDIGATQIPCRPEFCAAGETCLESGLCVASAGTGDCPAACAAGEVCQMGSCQAALPDPYVEDMPPANGMYNSLAVTPTGLALVYYDRSHGNLMGASWDGTAWGAPFLIDGYGTMNPDVGDSGIGASLVVDASGVWHVTYVDGAEEALRYARVEGGVPATEMIDDGSTDGATRHPDGRHIVGDDSSLAITSTGAQRVVYQDATAHRAMIAKRDAAGNAWTISVLDAEEHTGFWLEQILVSDASYVATWWQTQTGRSSMNGVRVLVVSE